MPRSHKIPLELTMAGIQRRIGLTGRGEISPRLKDVLLELMDGFINDRFIFPAVTYGIHPKTELIPEGLPFDRTAAVTHAGIFSLFPEAVEVAAAVATIGPKLETQVADFFRGDEPLKGFLLDGIGSALVDSLTGEVCKLIEGEASSKGLEAGRPFSPGMFGMSLKWQGKVLELASADSIGVRLTSASVMSPLKSASMITVIGPSMDKSTGDGYCTLCRMRETCSYRPG